MLDEAVELIAVQYQKTLSVPGHVHELIADLQVAQNGIIKIPHKFVMIPGHVNNPGPVFCLAENCPDDVIM